MVRQGVVRIGNADLWVGPRCRFVAHHECRDAGQVGLVGQHLQVEH